MKTLILYATKHGAAQEAAQRIAKKIDGSVIHDMKQDGIPSLAEFDCVIIGSSLYVGMIRKEAKAFMSQYADHLRGKKLGLFLCGLEESQEKSSFDNNFSPDILREAKAACLLGGVFDPKKSGAMGRLIMKAVFKSSAYENTISDDKIERFAEVMRA